MIDHLTKVATSPASFTRDDSVAMLLQDRSCTLYGSYSVFIVSRPGSLPKETLKLLLIRQVEEELELSRARRGTVGIQFFGALSAPPVDESLSDWSGAVRMTVDRMRVGDGDGEVRIFIDARRRTTAV